VNDAATHIEDTFAEAFGMSYTRLLITAHDQHWLDAAVRELTGYSSSVIACDAEAGVECSLPPDETPDGRPGAAVLLFGFSKDALAKAVPTRVGQCVMTCPSTAVYDGLPEAAKRIPLGKQIRFFGDGYQKSKLIDQRRFWRIPVMDGEFLVQEDVGVEKGVGGGNIIVQTETKAQGLDAARLAVQSIAAMTGVITPFPGGVARSGSKVGSRYKALPASTSDAFCPALRGRVSSKLHPDANCAYEIVIDGVSQDAVGRAMAAAMQAAMGQRVLAVSAGNYGGQLGKFHFHLRELLQG
jgi:formylmethanofuran--tetrahydromethanopterin N-formyltransferase